MAETTIPFEELFGKTEVCRLGIVGSRAWPDHSFVSDKIQEALVRWPTITHIVSGGQPKGVDGWAKAFARRQDLEYVEHLPAHWLPEDDPGYQEYHVSNFFNRNSRVVSDVDALLAFCFKQSGGTLDTYRKGIRALASEHVILYTERHIF